MQVPTNTDSLLEATSSLAFCPPGYVQGVLAQQARRAGPSAHLIPHSAPCATAATGLLEPSALPSARRFAFLKDLASNACANIYILLNQAGLCRPGHFLDSSRMELQSFQAIP